MYSFWTVSVRAGLACVCDMRLRHVCTGVEIHAKERRALFKLFHESRRYEASSLNCPVKESFIGAFAQSLCYIWCFICTSFECFLWLWYRVNC